MEDFKKSVQIRAIRGKKEAAQVSRFLA